MEVLDDLLSYILMIGFLLPFFCIGRLIGLIPAYAAVLLIRCIRFVKARTRHD